MQHVTDRKGLSTAILGCQLCPCTWGRKVNQGIHKSTWDPRVPDPTCWEMSPSLFLGFQMICCHSPSLAIPAGHRAFEGEQCCLKALLDAEMHPDHWGCWYKKLFKAGKGGQECLLGCGGSSPCVILQACEFYKSAIEKITVAMIFQRAEPPYWICMLFACRELPSACVLSAGLSQGECLQRDWREKSLKNSCREAAAGLVHTGTSKYHHYIPT